MFLQSYVTRKDKSLDKLFVGVVLVIVIFGFLAFLSASFGLLSRGTGPSFSSVMISQITFGLLPGLFFAFLLSKLHYTFWRRVAFFIFLFSVGLNLLLLVPAISLEHGGATRWLQIAGFTFQPSEFLKIAFILYFGSWLASAKDKIKETIFGVVPFLFILSITVGILIFERDTDTAVVITFTALAMYFISGARWRDIFIIFFIGMAGLASLFYIRPYLMDRLMTFFDPSRDPDKSSYQVNQSLEAIGSGGFLGRGFGQSIQKFSRLPEPIGDSIFAVIGEEFGFVGAVLLIIFILAFALLGTRIAIRSPDFYGRLVVFGIVILITTQSFVNVASMLGLIPISGLPLVFISHGGTSLLVSLSAVGIVFNVSRYS